MRCSCSPLLLSVVARFRCGRLGERKIKKKKLFDVKFRYHLWFFVKVLRLAISWKKIAAPRASTSVKRIRNVYLVKKDNETQVT